MLELFSWLLAFSSKIGYIGVLLLMAVESSFVPLPSEVIIPPAAYLAHEGEMNIYLVIIAGIAGSVIGAMFNYFLALTLGRKIIYSLANTRLAKLFFVNEDKVRKTEEYFLKYDNMSTFVGRLLPAVRHLISIPAGFSRMNFKNFVLYTTLGSTLWVVILAILGYLFGANKDLLAQHYGQISKALLIVGATVLLFYIIKKSGQKPDSK